MKLKEHTRNQKRMYRIHKQDEKIHDLELMIGKLQQENRQLKDNWNKLKELIEECLEAINAIQKLTGNAIEDYTPRILTYNQIKDKMQELEQGSDSNE